MPGGKIEQEIQMSVSMSGEELPWAVTQDHDKTAKGPSEVHFSTMSNCAAVQVFLIVYFDMKLKMK